MKATTPDGLRVLLVDTNPEGQRGSMALYGDMVIQAISVCGKGESVSIERLRLSLPGRFLDAIPRALRYRINHLWMMLTAGLRLKKRNADIFHVLDGSYAYVVNSLRARPIIITVHDVIPALQAMGSLSLPPGRSGQLIIGRSLKALEYAQSIIAVSGNTASDLGRVANVHAGRIRIVHSAVARYFTRPQDGTPIAQKRRSGKDAYILHVGNNAFYKNRIGVLRIFSLMSKECDLTLKMAGPAAPEEMKALARRLGVSGRVEFVVDPGGEQLAGLYRGASLFLFPSLYEGFGWPPLEAMACGCPVVCSDAGSLPEVVGDAALKCSPYDEETMAGNCMALLTDDKLAINLIQRGYERSSEFTLGKMGGELVDVYEEACDRSACTY